MTKLEQETKHVLDQKIDFAVVLSVTKANSNGDPLNDNRPRQTRSGHGEISDVAIKRKIRNVCMEMLGENILVQAGDRKIDTFNSLRERAESDTDIAAMMKAKSILDHEFIAAASRKWFDVRGFGHLFALKKEGKDKEEKGSGISIGIRGPISIHTATSVDPIEITTMQITKSVNSEPGEKRGRDTMGKKHRVEFGVYVFYGSINPYLAEKTGFSHEDAETLKQALVMLFENDASSARPEGSMEVHNVYWWKHNSKLGKYSSAKVHRSLKIEKKKEEPKSIADYTVTLQELEGLDVEVLKGR